jgi:hypothetical protein
MIPRPHPLRDLSPLPDAITAGGWRGCDTCRAAIERRAEFRRANWRGQSAAPLQRLRARAEQETASAVACRCHVCAG